MQKKPLERVLEIVGSQASLAAALGVTPQAVQQWNLHDRIPPERVLAVEALVKGRVTRYELRPDVYGPAPIHDCRCRESAA